MPDPTAIADRVDAIVFDLVGTLVDEAGTVHDEVAAVVDDPQLAATVAGDWSEQLDQALGETVSGTRPWHPEHENRRESLLTTLAAHGVSLDDERLERLATVGFRLRPWPGAAEQLAAIAARRPVCTLTNASFPELLEISSRGGLRWHAALSTELAETYKPADTAYGLAVRRLALDPRRTLFVAAHGWDLRGAAAQGFVTAHLPRAHANGPEGSDRVDIELGGLDELIGAL